MRPQILTLRPSTFKPPRRGSVQWLRSIVDVTMLVAVTLLVAAALAACGPTPRSVLAAPNALAACESPATPCLPARSQKLR